MEEIKNFIIECLPTMGDEQLVQLMTLLESLGVEEFQHLSVIEVEDLTGTLKVVQARLLKKKIDSAFSQENNAPIEKIVEAHTSGVSTVIVDSPMQSNDRKKSLTSIEFNRFDDSTADKLRNGKRPDPAERREMIRVIVAQVMEVIKEPRKCHMELVAAELVRLYPQSLKDETPNGSIGMGHSSLLCWLVARSENCKRKPPENSGLKRKSNNEGCEEKAPKKMKDSYGCVNFQPTELPTGESYKTLEEKKKFMQSKFNKSCNQAEIEEFMNLTFICQRSTINSGASVSSILKEWPFLRERRYAMAHSKELMGTSLKEKASTSFAEMFPDMKNFFREEKGIRGFDLEKIHLNYLELLATYFQEDLSHSFKIYEEGTSLDAAIEEAPVTPFIACIGDPYSLSPVCTVIVEKECMEKFIPLDDALLMWFSCYYLFNMAYPKDFCATLEFIQRVLYGINPLSKGTKMEKRFGKRVNCHPKVLKLLNNIRDFNSAWTV